MRLPNLLREAANTAWATKVPSALIVLLVAVMCAATLATVGRTAAAEAQLYERLDSAGARVLTVTEPSHDSYELINAATIGQTGALSSTERALGTITAIDVVNGEIGEGGERVPAWGIYGNLENVVTMEEGRWPQPGEALVSAEAMDRLNLDAPVGWVEQATSNPMEDWAIVGTFSPRDPFGDYTAGIVYPVSPDQPAATTLHVVLHDANHAGPAQSAVLQLLDPPATDHLTVQSPMSMAQLQDELTGDFTTFGRTLLLGVLAGGAFLVAIVVLADVLVRRKDLGRRRALGASRGVIVGLVLLRTMVPALLGAGAGVAGGLAMARSFEAQPPWEFTAGTAVLAVLAACVFAVIPAIYAATRDPVAVLRTP
ncbi:ABC transporter permease [Nesterenkonia ebinurensis]|uniref:ABC transporter permease n=1 Tax=Nesterenkonia ebinurensis TaxID=2608252 RepID=UPI00123D815F|nr:FtsX-like permease family protein [Nesterenkonia ebinurensis]